LAAGTDPNAKDKDGYTPLVHATLSRHGEIAKLLIADGAEMDAKDKIRETPMHYAAANGHK
jgi:ankyrin repeat protein